MTLKNILMSTAVLGGAAFLLNGAPQASADTTNNAISPITAAPDANGVMTPSISTGNEAADWEMNQIRENEKNGIDNGLLLSENPNATDDHSTTETGNEAADWEMNQIHENEENGTDNGLLAPNPNATDEDKNDQYATGNTSVTFKNGLNKPVKLGSGAVVIPGQSYTIAATNAQLKLTTEDAQDPEKSVKALQAFFGLQNTIWSVTK